MTPPRRVAVAAPNAACTAAALEVAADGGTAVDAAIAAVLVAMVSEPGVVSLDAGCFVTVLPSGAGPVVVDGGMAMPGLGRAADAEVDVREITTGYGGGVTMTVGPGSVAVSGALAAFDTVQSRYGGVPWPVVVGPAKAVAQHGFVLGTAAGYYLPYVRESVFAWDTETAAALRTPEGAYVETGGRMLLDGLADALAVIADEGARSWYDGSLADVRVADMAARGGLVTADDLATYEAVVSPALDVQIGDWSLHTNPPPSIGGPVLAALLTLLADSAPDDAAAMVEAQRRVLTRRRDGLDVASDRTAAAMALLAEVGWGGERAPSTVHVSAVDDAGVACAITASSGYGSGATVPGTGIWLNNCLGEHELMRGRALSPAQRLASNMAPSVGHSREGEVVAIGSPGADRITTALAQVLTAVARDGVNLQQAIDAPRLHVNVHGDGVRIEAEEDLALPDDVRRALGLDVVHHHPHSMYFGGVAAARRDARGGLLAAGDPRRAGAVAVSP